jgi:hypothetical protein
MKVIVGRGHKNHWSDHFPGAKTGPYLPEGRFPMGRADSQFSGLPERLDPFQFRSQASRNSSIKKIPACPDPFALDIDHHSQAFSLREFPGLAFDNPFCLVSEWNTFLDPKSNQVSWTKIVRPHPSIPRTNSTPTPNRIHTHAVPGAIIPCQCHLNRSA